MEIIASRLLAIDDVSGVAEARRVARGFGRDRVFDETEIGALSVVVTELATNIVKHAGTGSLVLQSTRYPHAGGLEIYALDSGPGIANAQDALRDGYSTGGTAGTGLGGVQRLSQHFDMYSRPGLGTIICVELWAKGRKTAATSTLAVGAVSVPLATEEVCGDNWCLHMTGDGHFGLLVVDGLGHGEAAALAADTAVNLFGSAGRRRLDRCGRPP
jgi:anti-sigma regulatory factor (Ser/Thr protein kinase)